LEYNKKTQLKERDALSEIYQDLKSDNEQLKKIIRQEGKIVRLIDSLNLEFKQRGNFTEDSLEVYLGVALLGNRLKFVSTAYIILLSSGIGLIQDKELRYLIAQYYEIEIPIVERDGTDTYEEWYDFILPIIRNEADYWV
jgi:hypothetical protein